MADATLVERLRKCASQRPSWHRVKGLLNEAADEIERLRALLPDDYAAADMEARGAR
jgi:hypothetical protein